MDPLRQLFEANRNAPRAYEVRAAKGGEAEILLYDAIGGFFGIDAGKFVKDLKGIDASTIHLRINSPGGDVFAARAIATAISEHPAKVIAHIDGLAASAASFLMLAADKIVASEGAFVMIHNPWALTIGDAADHQAQADLLSKISATMADSYASRADKSVAEAQGWMDAETWFTAAEAKDAGLVDEVIETTASKAAASALANWDLSAYRNAPVAAMATAAGAAPTHEVQGTAPVQTKEVQMDNPVTTGQTNAPDPNVIRAEERKRISEIHRSGKIGGVSADVIANAIENGTSAEEFHSIVFAEMEKASSKHDTRVGTPAATVTADVADKRRGNMVEAMLNRMNPASAVDEQNDFRMMSCLRMAEESLTRNGVSVRGKSPNEIAVLAMQQTSDFSSVLENVARKRLLARYQIAQPTYKLWSAPSTSPDFKTMTRPRLSEAPTFLKIAEGAQIQIGTMSDTKESYALVTAGRGISFTRQMLINDDLNAFNDLVSRFGDQAAIYENKTVYSILTANAALADTVALFYATTHINLGSGVIGNTALDAGFTAMGIQKGIDGVSILNITPKYLIVPKAKEATARAAVTAVGPSVKASDQNWFAGRLEVVADGVLDASSTVEWYLAADPGIYPGVEYCHLEGAQGPQLVRQENVNGILGVNLYAYLDFAAKAVDFRPLYKSSGS